MNNQRPGGDQIIRLLLLSFAAVLIYNHFFGPKPQTTSTDKRNLPAQALEEAFIGIAPSVKGGAAIAEPEARQQIAALAAAIKQNDGDEYSYWARLRSGLLQQYVLKDTKAAQISYQEVIDRQGKTPLDAQALYQKGDMLWRESVTTGEKKPSPEAVNIIEQLVHRGRGDAAFLNAQIYVEQPPYNATSSVFQRVKVKDWNGTLQNPNPQGILDRVNEYYKTTFFYRLFDTVVRLFGNEPKYSYGLAIIFFALFTRIALQPLNKKQYESMKGMQAVAPEMKKIQDKYKGKADPQAQQQMYNEIRGVYKKEGVSPMMGCALALIQMPLFFFVVYPLIQHFEARMELAGASFGWIHSLAHPDIPLLVIYGISMFFSFRLSSTPPTDDQQRMMQMMMSFVFPVVFPFFLISYPSAFTMYWMTFNVISTIFQYRMMKAADPEKSLIKTLMGKSPVPTTDTSTISPDAVPPRPKSSSGKKTRAAGSVTSGSASTNGKAAGEASPQVKTLLNGTTNGKSGSRFGNRKRDDNAAEGELAAVAVTEDGGEEEMLVDDGTDEVETSSGVLAQGDNAVRTRGGSGRSSSRRARRRRRH